MKDNKKELRKTILALRSSLTAEEVKAKSNKIVEKLISLKEFEKSSTVMCYVDFRNEVATGCFIGYCLKAGKKAAVPLVVDAGNMIAAEINCPEDDLEPGTFGVMEPKKCKLKEINPEEIDIIVVPGAVFDLDKNRIGYGAGFYDRFLPKLRRDCLKVGIAFDIQVVESVPVGEYDVPLELVITESRIIT